MPAVLTDDPLVEALARTEGRAEIVGGRVVRLMATGEVPSYTAGEVFARLVLHADEHGGRTATGNLAFIVDLPNRRSLSPDAAYYVPDGPYQAGFVRGAPLFAAEVRSEHDYGPKAERAIAAKRADYFAAGTRAVWDVDVLSDAPAARLYTAEAPGEPRTFGVGDEAHAEPALPGLRVPVASLLPPAAPGR